MAKSRFMSRTGQQMQTALTDKQNSDTCAGVFEIGAAPRQCPSVHRNHTASDRLDSWKEIAAHLKRTVRTVQRWERHEGLPVRRHLHARASSVYASKSEIDVWWNREAVQIERNVPCDCSENTTRKATKLHKVSIVRSEAKCGRPALMPFGSKNHYLPELAAIEICAIDKAGCRTPILRVGISANGGPLRARIETATKSDNPPSRLVSLAKNVLMPESPNRRGFCTTSFTRCFGNACCNEAGSR